MSDPDNVLKFDLALAEFPIEMNDSRTGAVRKFILREMTGEKRDKYLNGLQARMKTGKDGTVTGINNFSGLQADLLSLCMVEVVAGEEYVMDAVKLQALPAHVLTALHKKAKSISGLDADAETTEGND